MSDMRCYAWCWRFPSADAANGAARPLRSRKPRRAGRQLRVASRAERRTRKARRAELNRTGTRLNGLPGLGSSFRRIREAKIRRIRRFSVPNRLHWKWRSQRDGRPEARAGGGAVDGDGARQRRQGGRQGGFRTCRRGRPLDAETDYVSIYADLMLGSMDNWNNDYRVVAKTEAGSTAVCREMVKDTGPEWQGRMADAPMRMKPAILSYDGQRGVYIAVSFEPGALTGEEWLSAALSVRIGPA